MTESAHAQDKPVKKEVTPESLTSSEISQKPEDTDDVVKKEIKSPLKHGTEPTRPDPNSASSVLRDSSINNTEKEGVTKCLKGTEETDIKTVKQKAGGKQSKPKVKIDSNKCSRASGNSVPTAPKRVRTESNAGVAKSEIKDDTMPITSSNSAIVNCAPNGVITTSPSQSDTTSTSSTAPVTAPAGDTKTTENTKPAETCTSTTKAFQTNPDIHSKVCPPTSTLSEPRNISSSASQSETAASKTKPLKPMKTSQCKRPAITPVLIAPAPAKIPSMSPSVVDIAQVIKVEKTQQPLATCGTVTNNCSSNLGTPTVNLVSMLPVGLPTPSPSPRKLAVSRHPKASKNSKKFSAFTVANLLASHTPKRNRARNGPSVAHLKPPVLNFINTNSTSSSSTTFSRETCPASSVTPPLQTPYVPSAPGFISPLMLPQTQLYLSSNGVTPSGLRLTPTVSLQAQGPPIALGSQTINSTSSLVNPAPKPSVPALTIAFPSVRGQTPLPSLTNLPNHQSAFLSSTLPSVPASQLFSSIPTSLSSPLCFPVVSSNSSVSSYSVSSSSSSTSSLTTPSYTFTSTAKSSPVSFSSTSSLSVSSNAQAKSLTAAKGGVPNPPSSMSSPPPAASASPTPAAVPVQQSQTQGTDSGFTPLPNMAASTKDKASSGKRFAAASKTKARASSNTALMSGSKSKSAQNSQTNDATVASLHKNSSAFRPGPAFAQCSTPCNGKVVNPTKTSLAGKRNAATAFPPDKTEHNLSSSSNKKAKVKDSGVSSGLSCLPSSSLSSPCTPSSTATTSKPNVSPASALAQLCITSPTSQKVQSSSCASIKTPSSFVFPTTPSNLHDKSGKKSSASAASSKVLTNGISGDTKPSQPLNSMGVTEKKAANGTTAQSEAIHKTSDSSSKTPPVTPGPISPPGRSTVSKPKKKIADIANTLHKRVSESLQAQSSSSSPQDGTPNCQGTSTTISSSPASVAKSTITSKIAEHQTASSNGGGMLLPVTRPVSPSPPASMNQQSETLTAVRPVPTITCARHELPGRPLSLQNTPLAKGLSACLASRAEAKRISNTATVLGRSSTQSGHNGLLHGEEQPLNLVKKDSGYPHVASNLIRADMKHAVK